MSTRSRRSLRGSFVNDCTFKPMMSSGRSVAYLEAAGERGQSQSPLQHAGRDLAKSMQEVDLPEECRVRDELGYVLAPVAETITVALHDLVDPGKRVPGHQKIKVHGGTGDPQGAHSEPADQCVGDLALVEVRYQITKNALEIHQLPSDRPEP